MKLATTNTPLGSGLLSSWQSPDNPNGINAAVIIGTITATSNHGASHASGGTDAIPVGSLSPFQFKNTAIVSTSSFAQTIHPDANVIPLILEGNKDASPGLNLFEIWDNSAIRTKRFHVQGSGNAYFNGNVGIGTLDPTDKLEIVGNIRLYGGNKKILFSDPGNYDFSIVHNGGVSLDVRSPEKDGTITSFFNNGNVGMAGNLGVGTTNPTSKLEVAGGDIKVSGKITASSIEASGQYKDRTGDVMPVGVVLPFAGANIPQGWLLCDGTIYTLAAHPELTDLRQVLGSIHGGDGITTFRVPDLQGRTVIGTGEGPGITNKTLGQDEGEEFHTLTIAEMPVHNHSFTRRFSDWSFTPPLLSDARFSTINSYDAGSSVPTGINNAGGGLPHNNMQPSLVLNYIIKY